MRIEDWITSGHLPEAIVAFTCLEWLGLAVVTRRSGRGPDPAHLGVHLLAGVFLLLALRAALGSMSWVWIAAALTGALFAHIADLVFWFRR